MTHKRGYENDIPQAMQTEFAPLPERGLPLANRDGRLCAMSAIHAPTYRWTVDEYEALGRAGFFRDQPRVELLYGQIIVMSPIGYRHATAVSRLLKFFIRRSRDRFDVRSQNPFKLDPHSEPEPDLMLVDTACDTLPRLPEPAEIFLVIEVSDSTVRYDREDKCPAYAARGLREYWLLNLEANVLEVFRDPTGESYRNARTLGPDETVAPLAFPDLELRVGDFLP